MRCLTGARFNMTALVLVQGDDNDPNTPSVPVGNTNENPGGKYVMQQDPDSGAFVRVWIPDEATPTNPATPLENGVAQGRRIPCMVRGMADGGIRVAGTGERWDSKGTIDTVDYVTMKFPADVVLTARDRITDIRNNHGILIWKEEETDDSATVFEVTGVTPIVDPFGNWIENSTLLQRADVQRQS